MRGFETQGVEIKVFAILKIPGDSQGSLGGRVIARHLKKYGVEQGERTVRCRLKLMNEHGLSRLVGRCKKARALL
ncbi:winged-helix domain-containing protein [Chloroflexota bacterium]